MLNWKLYVKVFINYFFICLTFSIDIVLTSLQPHCEAQILFLIMLNLVSFVQ
jgi:phage-related holin